MHRLEIGENLTLESLTKIANALGVDVHALTRPLTDAERAEIRERAAEVTKAKK